MDRVRAAIRRTGKAPYHLLTPHTFHPHPALADLKLPQLATTPDLADWLSLTPDQLTRFADLRGLSARCPSHFAQHYRHHLQPKRAGGLRLIEEPKPFLKTLQRRILSGMLSYVPPHDAAFGFRAGRNCIQAAAKHAGEAVVISFDLADFFPGIGFARIYALFRTLGYPPQVARALAGLTTAITPPDILQAEGLSARESLTHRHLPQGAPTSPALANLVAHRLDRRLTGLARSVGAAYTRYADDLTFSGDTCIAEILTRAVPQIVREENFRLNPAKTRITRATDRQSVTGIVVNQRANIPRPDYDRLKAVLHHLTRTSDPRRADPAFLARLSGQIAWVEQVNPARGHRLRGRLDGLMAQ